MKAPKQCPCPVHQAAAADNYSEFSYDPALIRRVRRDSLDNARRWRERAKGEPDQLERNWLEACAVCAEWGAWICLLRLREIRAEGSSRVELLRQARRPGKAVDHIDGDPTNNDLGNLRVVRQRENRGGR
jgi:hypothetical protein